LRNGFLASTKKNAQINDAQNQREETKVSKKFIDAVMCIKKAPCQGKADVGVLRSRVDIFLEYSPIFWESS